MEKADGSPVPGLRGQQPANQFIGTVISCAGTSLIIGSTQVWGSGSHSDWTVTQGGYLGHLISFDPSDATGSTFYATSAGIGFFECTGATTAPNCTKITAPQGTPTTFTALRVDRQGQESGLSTTTGGGPNGVLHSYTGGMSGTWTSLSSQGKNWQTLTYDSNSCSSEANCVITISAETQRLGPAAASKAPGQGSNSAFSRAATDYCLGSLRPAEAT